MLLIILEALSNGNWIAIIAIAVTFLGILIGIVNSLLKGAHKLGTLEESVKNIKSSMSDVKDLVSGVPAIHEKVNALHEKVGTLWANAFTKSNSPVVLNERGKKILEDSNIKEFTNQRYNEILNTIKESKPANAYRAQEILIETVREFKKKDECQNEIEKAAYRSGVDVDAILLVAAIDIRDKVIKDLGLEIEDVDRFDPKKNITDTEKAE